MIYLRLLMNSLIDCNSTAFTINAEYLLSDKGYDSDEIIKKGEKQGMIAVIPPRKNRKVPREYDKNLYKLRH
jgi:hypothetical protein